MDFKEQKELIGELSDSIHEIRINTKILVTKLEQVNINIEKLEARVEDLHVSKSEQEKRLTILEQVVPANLIEDMALIKQTQSNFTRVLWLLGGATLTVVLNMLMDLLIK